MAQDYYDILGVSKAATQDEIKKAFRKKAHEYHPDKKSGDEKKFKEVNEAYQTIGNEQKRKQYDQFGSAFNGQGGFGGATSGFGGQGMNWQDFARNAQSQGGFSSGGVEFDLGDIFGDFFGGGRGRRQASTRGNDLEYVMDIDIKESAFGSEKLINLDRMGVCDNCIGKGYDSKAKVVTCPECKGSGQVSRVQRTILGAVQTRGVCPTCNGEGKKPDKFCAKCHGAGRVKKVEQLKIKIPAGINEGQSIKLAGKGEAGEKGAVAGDLYITFRIRTDRKFKREGYDILSREEIDMTQAMLGDKIEVETLEGPVRLKVPAGTESGKIFKLVGKGAEKLHGRGKGDHLVKVAVKIPKNLSRKAKKLLEELKNEI